MMKALIPIMAFLLTVSPVMAQIGEQGQPIWQNQYCDVDNTTLIWVKNVSLSIPEKGLNRTILITEHQVCNWGCNNNECLAPPWIMWAFALGITIVIVFLYLVFRPKG